MALAVFDPAETGERTADMSTVADVIEKPGDQKKQGKPDDHDAEPHGLHANWDHKENQRSDRHSRVEGGKRGNQSRDSTRGSNQGRAGIDHELQHATGDATKQVEEDKISRTQNALEDVSCEPEAHHIDGEVQDSRMEKLVGDELPKHSLAESRTAQPEEMVGQRLLPLRQDFDKDKSENIQADESLDRRELDISVAVQHERKVVAVWGNVHTETGCLGVSGFSKAELESRPLGAAGMGSGIQTLLGVAREANEWQADEKVEGRDQ